MSSIVSIDVEDIKSSNLIDGEIEDDISEFSEVEDYGIDQIKLQIAIEKKGLLESPCSGLYSRKKSLQIESLDSEIFTFKFEVQIFNIYKEEITVNVIKDLFNEQMVKLEIVKIGWQKNIRQAAQRY
ncbi:hypothetical protein C1646_747680 [Rhizophagus diaphanus]|nr:hypothetical protein C1646_747680 [Rhizophagus diaphanus] [Rhizophagus sp. MUCL 43196]